MTYRFDINAGLIVVLADVWGPKGVATLRLALDTGATYSLVRLDLLELVGYANTSAGTRIKITTASGVEDLPQITAARFRALGQERRDFSVLCHTLPPSANLDGLLGLDFLRGRRLTLDFRTGTLTMD